MRRLLRLTLAVATAALLGIVARAGGAEPPSSAQLGASAPRTLVSLRGPIFAFAQDGGRIAWMSAGRPCGAVVRIRTLETGRQSSLTRAKGATCRESKEGELAPGVSLALAGERALWTVFTGSLSRDVASLITASPGDRADKKLDELEFEGGATGPPGPPPSVPMAGDGSILVYVRPYEAEEELGTITRVVGRRQQRVPGIVRAYAVAVANGRVGAVTQPPGAGAGSPAWSPDGTKIAFHGPRGIYVVNADGSAQTRLAGGCCPTWSPDGRKIAFGAGDIYVVNADGSALEKLFEGDEIGGQASEPAWSPDGREIAFAAHTEVDNATAIYVMNVDGSGLSQLTPGNYGSTGGDGDPAWSPDGGKIAFASARDDASPSEISEIYVMNADGTRPRRLTRNERYDRDPAWSPDGRKIVFERGGETRSGELYVMNADGSGQRRLKSPVSGYTPAWSPDGRKIAFGRGEIYVTDVEGAERRRLTTFTRPAPVQIRRARRGALLRRFEPQGLGTQAIALSRSLVALLTESSSGLQIERYDAATGRLRGATDVPAATAPELSLAGRRIVFRTGKTIRLLDEASGSISVLAVAAGTPIGLSIEGRRVAWAENVRGRGRVQAVFLPAG